jgi:hypothetical protein
MMHGQERKSGKEKGKGRRKTVALRIRRQKRHERITYFLFFNYFLVFFILMLFSICTYVPYF